MLKKFCSNANWMSKYSNIILQRSNVQFVTKCDCHKKKIVHSNLYFTESSNHYKTKKNCDDCTVNRHEIYYVKPF